MLKRICKYLLLLIPSLICIIWLYLGSTHDIMNNDGAIPTVIITAYIISVAVVIFCIKLKPFSVWWMPLSFLVSPIPVYIYEYPGGSFMPFLGTALVSMVYAAPLFIVSMIVASVISIGDYSKANRLH